MWAVSIRAELRILLVEILETRSLFRAIEYSFSVIEERCLHDSLICKLMEMLNTLKNKSFQEGIIIIIEMIIV